MKNKGKQVLLSNNSSRSVDQYVAKLHKMNIPCTPDDVLLSTHDLLAWLQKEGVTKTWAIATKGMCQMMEDVGSQLEIMTPNMWS